MKSREGVENFVTPVGLLGGAQCVVREMNPQPEQAERFRFERAAEFMSMHLYRAPEFRRALSPAEMRTAVPRNTYLRKTDSMWHRNRCHENELARIRHFLQFVGLFGRGACWLWQGPLMDRGDYGVICGKPAHRRSFELFREPIPDGMQILHACDTPKCVNPGHLFLGTDVENKLDRARKYVRVAGG